MSSINKARTTIYGSSAESAMGACVVLATENGICWTGTPGTEIEVGLNWVRRKFGEIVYQGSEELPVLHTAMKELRAYLGGERLQFDCKLDLRGTPFQLAVWQALYQIPYGETRTYHEIAYAIGKPQSARPVGGACGANPVAVIVPCHRVIGSNGQLTGYGGGLPAKKWLQALEQGHEYIENKDLAVVGSRD